MEFESCSKLVVRLLLVGEKVIQICVRSLSKKML